MIQRKQTVFLLVAFILSAICLCLPLAHFDQGIGQTGALYNLWIVSPSGTHQYQVWALFAILLLTCPITLVAVFSFHNRKTQSRYCLFNMLLLLGWYIVFAVFATGLKAAAGNLTYSITAVFPLVALLLNFMARKAILADEALVKAADRIR